MARAARALLAAGAVLLFIAGPAFAQGGQEPQIDLTGFLAPDAAAQWTDRNGDHIPDLPTADGIPVGIAGLWDDAVGAVTPEEFLARVNPDASGFDQEQGAALIGPCGGVAISYDAHGESLDAAVDLGDGRPPMGLNGEATFTSGNPFRVDSGGMLAYFGFTLPDSGLSNGAFHDHQWEVVIMGISADHGGDPNVEDKNHNAGLIDLGELLPFQFRLKGKVQAAFVDGWGAEDLPDYSQANLGAFSGHTFCFGEGWVQFEGESFPLFTVPGAVASALALAGFAGLLFNARPALSWRA